MSKTTSLYSDHLRLHAKMIEFHGWALPLHYGSQIEEHNKVRQNAGMFDVSHMTVIDMSGPDTQNFLLNLLANHVARLNEPGKALYTCMLNQQGGVIDDLIVYWRGNSNYRLVTNAGTHDKDLAWIEQQAKPFKVTIKERTDLAMIAVQGPEARSNVLSVLPQEFAAKAESISRFSSAEHNEWFIGRTGYTGEDGFEILLPNSEASLFWNTLQEQHTTPCGLGARDTLRLEAGMNLYGNDMDESVTPLVSNLEWTVAWEPVSRHFIGRQALAQQKQKGLSQKMVGLVLEGKGVLRAHQKVKVENSGDGIITSGTFSPTLKCGIALARVPIETKESCAVLIRDKLESARVIQPPFVRNGKKTF